MANYIDKITVQNQPYNLYDRDFREIQETKNNNYDTDIADLKQVTINNKPITDKNINLTNEDVNALPSNTTHISGDVPIDRTINGKTLEQNIVLTASDIKVENSASATETILGKLNSLQTQITNLISSSFEVVSELPTTDISANKIYLISATSDNDNSSTYDEYIYVNDNWERIGTTKTDLSNYYTKTQIDNKLATNTEYGMVKLADSTSSNTLSKVASTGNYSDLTNKPTIPSGEAADKNVDTVISTSNKTSTNLPTTKAVFDYVNNSSTLKQIIGPEYFMRSMTFDYVTKTLIISPSS